MAPPACGGGPGLLCCLRGLRPSCLERGGTVAHLLRIVLSYGGRRLVAYRQPELPIGNCICTLVRRPFAFARAALSSIGHARTESGSR